MLKNLWKILSKIVKFCVFYFDAKHLTSYMLDEKSISFLKKNASKDLLVQYSGNRFFLFHLIFQIRKYDAF